MKFFCQSLQFLYRQAYHTSGISPDSPGFLVLSEVMSGIAKCPGFWESEHENSYGYGTEYSRQEFMTGKDFF
jgi:hypothetical protein